jgi:hypothetical protein
MMPSAEKNTLVGKANSFIQNLISNPLEQTTSSNIFAVQPGSPRSLALQRNDLEQENIQEISQMTADIQQKEFELQGLAEGEDSNNTHKLLESQLKILEDKTAVFSDCKLTKFKAAQALDTQIGLIQEAEMGVELQRCLMTWFVPKDC